MHNRGEHQLKWRYVDFLTPVSRARSTRMPTVRRTARANALICNARSLRLYVIPQHCRRPHEEIRTGQTGSRCHISIALQPPQQNELSANICKPSVLATVTPCPNVSAYVTDNGLHPRRRKARRSGSLVTAHRKTSATSVTSVSMGGRLAREQLECARTWATSMIASITASPGGRRPWAWSTSLTHTLKKTPEEGPSAEETEQMTYQSGPLSPTDDCAAFD